MLVLRRLAPARTLPTRAFGTETSKAERISGNRTMTLSYVIRKTTASSANQYKANGGESGRGAGHSGCGKTIGKGSTEGIDQS